MDNERVIKLIEELVRLARLGEYSAPDDLDAAYAEAKWVLAQLREENQ